MLNETILMGRTTTKPELKTEGPAEKPVELVNFNIAVDRDFGEDADFFPCVAFAQNAHFLDKYVEKGQLIVVKGRLKNNSWEDEKGKHKVTEVIVEKVYFAGGNKKNSSPAASNPDNVSDASNEYI